MAIRVVAYDKSRFNSIEDALYEDSKNYQDANNPAIRYTNRRTGLNGDSFGAKTYNTIEEAQEEIDAWVSNASINGTDGLGWAILDGKTVISKSKKLSKSHRFNVVNYQRKMPIDLDESEYNKVIGGEDSGEWFSNSINGRDFLGSAYYLPDENRLYHVYYDGKYDEDDVEQFGRLRHAFVYYDDEDDDEDDDYSASTKKSRMLSKSFNDMVKSIRRSASGQIIKSEGNLEQYLNEKVEIAHGSGRIRMEYITLKEAIDKYGIASLGNPDDPRVFARCPKLNGFLKPMRPNDGFIARYESQSAYDSLSF